MRNTQHSRPQISIHEIDLGIYPDTGMTVETTRPAPARRHGQTETRLGKEISDFLIELSIAVHRYSMYPLDHPSLEPAATNVRGRLTSLLADRAEVSLGIAQRQLVIDGVATDERNPVLTDLAKRLHSHQIGAITFTDAASVGSLEGLLETLAIETERDGDPIGLRAAEEIPTWEGVRLVPVGYSELALDEEAESEHRTLHLWLGLAQAAMTEFEAGAGRSVPDAEELAESINGHGREKAYDQVIVGYLLQIADELSESGGGDRLPGGLRNRVSSLIENLSEDTLRRILDMGGETGQRRQFVKRAVKGLDTEAAVKILQAAADASGHDVSTLMVRMLTKLSFHSEEGADGVRRAARDQFRGKVDELIKDWTLDSPNPDGYVRILDEFSRTSPLLGADAEEFEHSALHVVQMALEVDSYGPMVESALDELLVAGELPDILPLVEGAVVTPTGKRIRDRIGSPRQIRTLAEQDDVDDTSLGLLIELVGSAKAVEPLLYVLSESESRGVRRKVFDRLVCIGDQVAPHLPRFLEDPRWYVVRNLLALAAEMPGRIPGFSVAPFIGHVDIRVRREALPLALAEPDLRVKALVRAFREDDERMQRTALLDLENGIPSPILPTLLDRFVRNEDVSTGMRVMAVRSLAGVKTLNLRTALVGLVSNGRNFLGRAKLKPLDDVGYAALGVLAQSWAEDPVAKPILRTANRSRNAAVRRSVREVA